ncbi:hypothetical protein P691DRAFT_703138 [Macrolepiota fuliginosa MF-IS2]|uniref:Uncharacterized protein n=1 Tax=Macrolepiota fuliginosa MF-IS2 TaxID=1400762 RepID=A0A9P5XFN4_9AGAR|nr:hypothetical protein P691DRAFT_703138 [Macrolepiota fuliginosa MF-IS2]
MASSKQFAQIYHTLPPESQQAFVEEQLVPLLDSLSSKKRDRIIRAVKRSQARYDGIPQLDLLGKTREVRTLLMMLAKDDKVAFSRERSNREEILQEIVHSISSWLGKIWITVYEYKANYEQAHECLLYVLRSLAALEESPGVGDCKCLYNNMYVTVSLKDKERRTVKYFGFTGPRNLDQVCLWIWRDLLLSMLVEDPRSRSRVQTMLLDIEEAMGWQGLERVLHGGRRKSSDDDDDDFLDDEEDEDFSDDEEDSLRFYEDAGTDDEYNIDSDGEERCCCRFHAKYWSNRLNEERITLRDIVKARLLDIFREAPDADLFGAIGSIAQDSTSRTRKQLLRIVSDVAGDSVESLRAALTIHTNLSHPWKILKLLENHYHLLRPGDCPTLLPAVATLADSPCRPQALKFIERELFDSVQHIYMAIRSTFSHFAEEPNLADLAEILKLPSDSLTRASRIERWVDRVLTSTSSEPLGPMAFAAMMMGFPLGPPSASMDDTDLLAYIDLNKPDPDLDDLREEFKPQLKPHFETWNLYAQTMSKDCSQLLHRVYGKIVELMPCFRASDIVNEMTNRISERPNKSHIRDAMLCIQAFCKGHRRRLAQHADQRRRSQKKTAVKSTMTANNSMSRPSTSTTTTNNPGTGPPPAAGPAPPPAGPVFHFFSANPPLTTNPNPTPGGTGPILTPMPPPPGCNHQ